MKIEEQYTLQFESWEEAYLRSKGWDSLELLGINSGDVHYRKSQHRKLTSVLGSSEALEYKQKYEEPPFTLEEYIKVINILRTKLRTPVGGDLYTEVAKEAYGVETVDLALRNKVKTMCFQEIYSPREDVHQIVAGELFPAGTNERALDQLRTQVKSFKQKQYVTDCSHCGDPIYAYQAYELDGSGAHHRGTCP